ncbi:MAG: hypothetical protein CL840_06255 [Crocinitomicaceae bacterium]|nr:hypothetical protein [Crocinitomicaceae bacterium]|tara:strand:- start:8910 stop:10472 length:1563 start_codon:yes stop_codon:yes gene_type:complete
MNKILIAIITIILSTNLFAQQSELDWAEIQWGTEMKVAPGIFWGTQRFTDDLYLNVWRDGVELHIISTTGNMNLIKQRELKIEHAARKGKYYFESIFRLGDKLCLMSKIKVKKEEKFYYYVQTIDPNSLEIVGEPVQVGEMTFLRSSFKEIEDFVVSPDYSKMYFGHNNGTRDLKKFWYELEIFDAELESIYADKIEIENDEALNTAYIDFWKNGDVAVLAKRVIEKKDREKDKPNYYYTAAVMRNGEVQRYKVDLGSNFISGAGITFGKNGDLIISGYYSPNAANRVNGVFFIREDISGDELGETMYKEFTVEEIMKFASERQEKKAKKKEDKGREIELNDYTIHDLFETDNGVFLLAEQYWMRVEVNRSSNGMVTTTFHYYYMDVMALKFTTEGEVEWMARVPKYNYSKNDGGRYSSFNYDYNSNSVYLLYNDHIGNHIEYNPRRILKTPWGGKKSVTCLAQIDNEGNMKRGYLYNVAEEALFTKVKQSAALDEDTGFMIIAQKKKKFKLARVTTKEE